MQAFFVYANIRGDARNDRKNYDLPIFSWSRFAFSSDRWKPLGTIG